MLAFNPDCPMLPCKNHTHCIDTAIDKAEVLCRKNDLRFTEIRRTVLRLIWANHEPAKAYDILDQLKNEHMPAKPPTVYRALDFLLENHFVHKLSSLNAYIGCPHPGEHSQCYFLICNKCNKVQECCNQVLTEAVIYTTHTQHFKPKHTTLEIQGICQQCVQH